MAKAVCVYLPCLQIKKKIWHDSELEGKKPQNKKLTYKAQP